MRVAVVGGGAVGASAALALTMEGHRVTLFEADPEGRPASYGNAGHIGVASIVPWANPSNRRHGLRYRGDRLHPLRFRVSDMLRRPDWIAKFLAASGAEQSQDGAGHLNALLRLGFETLVPLLAEAGAKHLIRRDGLLHVFRKESAFRAARSGFELRERFGVQVKYLDQGDLTEIEPAFATGGSSVSRAVLLPEVGQILSPEELVRVYRNRLRTAGGALRHARVQRISGDSSSAVLRLADGTEERFERAVIAAGAASTALARPLGASVPVIAERGYHLHFSTGGELLRRSVLYVDRRVVFSPTTHGLRLTTGAEFTRSGREPDPAWMEPIFEAARDLLDGVPPISEAVRWSGDRPSTPDSLPVIGPAPRAPAVLLAYGHGHSGLTMAAPTAALITDLAGGRAPRLDLAPYSPVRAILWEASRSR